jgi:hypothetical protein
VSRFRRRFTRQQAEEVRKFQKEIASIPVSEAEAEAAKVWHEKFLALINEGLSAGVDTIPICAGLGSAAAMLGHRMCEEKGGADENRGTWLAFFAMVVSASLKDARATEVAERLGRMLSGEPEPEDLN